MTSRRKERVGGGKTTARPSTQQGAADPPRSPIARGSSGARTPGRPTTAQTMEYMAMTPKTATAALARSQHHSVSLPDLGATMPATLPRSARAKTPNPSLFTRTGAPLRRDAAAENPWTPPERHTKTSLQDTAYAGRSKLVTLFKNTAIDDPEEFLMSLQKANDGEHKAEARARKEAERLEGYNQFSRPMLSDHAPLRTLLMDEEKNNIEKCGSLSEFRERKATMNQPHPSYDIDGDGYVSQEDLWLSKRFDMDGNGVLDPDEQEVGRFLMAQAFFRSHRDDLHLYGPEWNAGDRLKSQWQKCEKDNIDRLATAHTFQKILSGLKETEKHYRDIGSNGVTETLILANKGLTAHNFYSDKFDTTAWNDHGANPRFIAEDERFARRAKLTARGSAMPGETMPLTPKPKTPISMAGCGVVQDPHPMVIPNYGARVESTARRNDIANDHGGSRHTLKHLQKVRDRDICATRLDKFEASQPQYSRRRVSFITNLAIENS